MPKPNKATQEKEAKRALRKENKENKNIQLKDGVDPDLLGIYPGPQPRKEY